MNLKNSILIIIFFKDALTKNFLGTSEEIEQTASLTSLKKERPSNYRPYTTTLIIQRKNYCAKVITRSVREFSLKMKAEKIRLKRKATFDDDDDEKLE